MLKKWWCPKTGQNLKSIRCCFSYMNNLLRDVTDQCTTLTLGSILEAEQVLPNDMVSWRGWCLPIFFVSTVNLQCGYFPESTLERHRDEVNDQNCYYFGSLKLRNTIQASARLQVTGFFSFRSCDSQMWSKPKTSTYHVMGDTSTPQFAVGWRVIATPGKHTHAFICINICRGNHM